jgi:hypothetical protein
VSRISIGALYEGYPEGGQRLVATGVSMTIEEKSLFMYSLISSNISSGK